jgi:uncharacterized protein (DUF2461 family)
MGFYSAARETMDNLRRFIEAKPAEFRKIVAAFGKQDTFTLGSECSKRLGTKGLTGKRTKHNAIT